MISLGELQKLSNTGPDILSKLGRLLRPTWNILTVSLVDGIIVPRKQLCVSIESGCLWVALGSRFLSKTRINRFRRFIFEDGKFPNPESVASALSLALKDLGASSAGITLSVPRSWIVARTAELPAVAKDNIVEVVSYELDRLTPLGAEDAYYDFRILNEQNEKLSLALFAVRADMINQYLEAMKEWAVSVERLTINPSGLATLCRYVTRKPDFIFLDINSHSFEGGLVRGNRLAHTFGGSFPGGDEGSRIATVVSCIEPLIDGAVKQGVRPTVTVCAGDGISRSLEKHVSVPVSMLSSKDVEHRLSAGKEHVSYTAMGGVLESLWPDAGGVNMLSKGSVNRAKLPVACTLILLALIVATLIPFAVLPVQKEEKKLAEINRQISLRKEEVKRVETLKKAVEDVAGEIAVITDFKETAPAVLTVLTELTTILPKTVWLTRTRITDKTVEIEGYASSASEILPKLEESKYFRKVEFASPTLRVQKAGTDRFMIKMELEGFKNQEAEKQKDAKKK